VNRIVNKPYIELPEYDDTADNELVASESWNAHKARNESIIVDEFHGLYRSRMHCRSCGHTSIKFDPYMSLTVELPRAPTELGKTLLSRLQMMYFLREKIKPTRSTEMPTVLGNLPAHWWGENEDKDILLGVLKYGYGKYDPIRTDEEYCFHQRKYSNVAQLQYLEDVVPSSEVKEDIEEMDETEDIEGERKTFENIEEDLKVSEPSLSQDDKVVIEESKNTDQTEKDLSIPVVWPSAGDIGKRIRSIVSAFMRNLSTKASRAAKVELKRQQQEERSRMKSEKDGKRNGLTRKEKQ
ncbi:hypothetical protein HK096_011143, partial [Nowakowskiella sp. JEL0078]